MRIAIAGLGISGSYLFHLLRDEGFSPDVYEVPQGTRCRIHPCAWCASTGFVEQLKEVGLDPNDYILCRFDHIAFGDITVPIEAMTFNKPCLIKELSGSAEVKLTSLNPGEYDRIIDATGVARAFLPPVKNDLVIRCVQYRLHSKKMDFRINPGGVGYAWNFPLGDELHLGCGCLRGDPEKMLEGLGWDEVNDRDQIICGCKGSIRVSGPSASEPFVTGGSSDVWGLGEAIGCVSPLAGDGVVSGMRSARILVDNWDDPEGYVNGILSEFSWMDEERKVLDRVIRSGSAGVRDARVLLRNSKRMGIRMGVIDALRIIRSLI